jgi:transketolase
LTSGVEATTGPLGQGAAMRLGMALAGLPWLMGGSADLAPSTKTLLTFDGAGDFSLDNPGGRNFHFGVREHAMEAVINGMSLCKIRPYGYSARLFRCSYL